MILSTALNNNCKIPDSINGIEKETSLSNIEPLHISISYLLVLVFMFVLRFFLFLTSTSHNQNCYIVTYCLLRQRIRSILQPQHSGFCHQWTIVIALPQLVFTVISKFCCLWWMIYMPYRELEVPEARYSSFLKGTLRSSLLMSRISETLSNVT